MSMPSKGSRPIRVGGHDYRWRVRRTPTYDQAQGSPMSVSIQSCAEGARSVLVVNLRVTRPDNWFAAHQTALTPDIVRDIILRAMAAGWDPLGPRSPFAFEYGLIQDSAGS
jgi:hypothetical protein